MTNILYSKILLVNSKTSGFWAIQNNFTSFECLINRLGMTLYIFNIPNNISAVGLTSLQAGDDESNSHSRHRQHVTLQRTNKGLKPSPRCTPTPTLNSSFRCSTRTLDTSVWASTHSLNQIYTHFWHLFSR